MTIADRIRDARKAAKMTQKELAQVTGLAEITIRNYEADKYKPKYEQSIKLADALGVDANWLMHGQTLEERDTAYKAKAVKRFEEARAWKDAREIYLQGIPDEDKRAFDTLAKTIRENIKEE